MLLDPSRRAGGTAPRSAWGLGFGSAEQWHRTGAGRARSSRRRARRRRCDRCGRGGIPDGRGSLAPKVGPHYAFLVRVISRRTLRDFWRAGHTDAEQPLKAWFAEVSKAAWKSTAEIKRKYPSASVIDAERVVFNIGGNKYRLVVKLWFPGQAVWIKFIGSHKRYDNIDVRKR